MIFRRQTKRRRATDQIQHYSNQIGAGCTISGSLTGSGNYLVQGEVVGNGELDGAVKLAAGAFWKGELVADYVKVAGKVDGNVTARTRLELEPTAVVTGNLSSPVIAIAEGATYEGTISRPRKTQVTRFTDRRAIGGGS